MSQLEMRPVPDGQLTLGESLRDNGMRVVSENVDQDWKDAADAEILRQAATGERFTVEDIREVVGEPDKANAWGARFGAASKRDLIFFVGFEQSSRAPRHAGMIRVWRGTTKALQSTQKPPVSPAHPTQRHNHGETG